MSEGIKSSSAKRLANADKITENLKNSDSLKEMAAEISSALLQRISRSRYMHLKSIIKSQPQKTFDCRISEQLSLCCLDSGGLQGQHKLEDLIAELIAAYVGLHAVSGKKNLDNRPSFAFVAAALSALPHSEINHPDLMKICRSARDEVAELAAAAVIISKQDPLTEIVKGMAAVVGNGVSLTTFGLHVAAVLKAHRTVSEKNGCRLQKGTVREEAEKLLKAKGCHCYPDDPQWRKVYKAAGLASLPQEHGKRGKARRGGSN